MLARVILAIFLLTTVPAFAQDDDGDSFDPGSTSGYQEPATKSVLFYTDLHDAVAETLFVPDWTLPDAGRTVLFEKGSLVYTIQMHQDGTVEMFNAKQSVIKTGVWRPLEGSVSSLINMIVWQGENPETLHDRFFAREQQIVHMNKCLTNEKKCP